MRQMAINENDYNMLMLKLNHAYSVSELLITDSEFHSWGENAVVGAIGTISNPRRGERFLGKAKTQA